MSIAVHDHICALGLEGASVAPREALRAEVKGHLPVYCKTFSGRDAMA